MGSHLTVVYDACVLYPAPLRDLLMHLALSDLFRARWSEQIHDEWTRNVLASRSDLNPEQLGRTRQLMNAHVRGSLVSDFEHLIDTIQLPDPDDRHVVAAAIHSGASLIVTFNLKDFPSVALSRYNPHARHPDDFIVELFDVNWIFRSKRSQYSEPREANIPVHVSGCQEPRINGDHIWRRYSAVRNRVTEGASWRRRRGAQKSAGLSMKGVAVSSASLALGLP